MEKNDQIIIYQTEDGQTKVDVSIHEPSFLMVLTGTDSYAYQRKDGVYVVPVGCLRD